MLLVVKKWCGGSHDGAMLKKRDDWQWGVKIPGKISNPLQIFQNKKIF